MSMWLSATMSSSTTQQPAGSPGASSVGKAAALNQFLSRAHHSLLSARFTGHAATLVEEPRTSV
jgi:hypothetical protein